MEEAGNVANIRQSREEEEGKMVTTEETWKRQKRMRERK